MREKEEKMISKELLSEVLGEKVEEIGRIIDTTILAFRYSTHWSGINIYELAHKCKGWAYNKDHILTSWKDRDCFYCEIDDNVMSFSSENNEPEAIFKACEWIRNNQ